MVEKVPSWIERLLLPRLSEIAGEIKALNAGINSLEKVFDERISSLEKVFNERITSLEEVFDERVTSLRNEVVSLRNEMVTRFELIENRYL